MKEVIKLPIEKLIKAEWNYKTDGTDDQIQKLMNSIEFDKSAGVLAVRKLRDKYEVIDAIPYNGPIMTEAGVTVAYNSDSSEVIRRLNQEAAKAVKYGGLIEEEAWKYVTLNPAKLLHIDDRVGSLKEGKDADLVLWSDNPLSIYASAEKTLIDGKIYYDSSKIPSIIEEMKIEKDKIIDQIKSATNGGQKLQPIESSSNKEFFCETVDK